MASSAQGPSSTPTSLLAAAAGALHAWLLREHAHPALPLVEGSAAVHPHRLLQGFVAQSQAVALINTTSSNEAMVITTRVKDTTQLSQLSSMLSSAGIVISTSALRAETVIMRVESAASAPPPPNPYLPGANAVADSGASTANRWIMIAAGVAGGVAVVLVLVGIVYAYVRRRRSQQSESGGVQKWPLLHGGSMLGHDGVLHLAGCTCSNAFDLHQQPALHGA